MYAACNEGRYSEIESILTADLLSATKGPLGQMAGGIKGICEKNTRGGTLVKVVVLKEDIRGEGATVTANLHFKDGNVKHDDITELVKEKGSWRVSH